MITQLWVGAPIADHTVLDADEQRRADAMRNPATAQEFRASRSWLRVLLGDWLGRDPAALRFGRGAHGKPTLAGVEFNVAHSAGITAVAIADRPVGVDIERIGRLHTGPGVRRSFTATERKRLATADRITAAWTVKEAYTKAIGTGHATAFSRLAVDPPARGWIGRWRVADAVVSVLEAPAGYTLAVSDHEFVVRRAGVLGGQVVRDPVFLGSAPESVRTADIVAAPVQQDARRLGDEPTGRVGP